MMYAIATFVILAGLFFVVSAVMNWDWYKSIAEYAVIDGVFGEGIVRIVCGVFGLMLVGTGIVIAIQAK